METFLLAVGGILSLIGLGAWLAILVEAFKDSLVQGLLCLFVPCYGLYYAFARLDHARKALVLVLWLGGGLLGQVCLHASRGFARSPAISAVRGG